MMKIFILAITTLIFTLNCSNHNIEVTSQKKHIPKILSEGDKIIFEKYEALYDISEYVSEGYPETILIIGKKGAISRGSIFILIDSTLFHQTGKVKQYSILNDKYPSTGHMTITKITDSDFKKINQIIIENEFNSLPEILKWDQPNDYERNGFAKQIYFSNCNYEKIGNFTTSVYNFREMPQPNLDSENYELLTNRYNDITRFGNCYDEITEVFEKYNESRRFIKFERYIEYILNIQNMKDVKSNYYEKRCGHKINYLKSAPFRENWDFEDLKSWNKYFERYFIKDINDNEVLLVD